MTDSITIAVPGDPVGKGRARSRYVEPKGKPGFVTHYTPTKTRKYESLIRETAAQVMKAGALTPYDGPITMDMVAFMPIPASWPEWRRAAAISGEIVPTVKPDFDNLIKVCDALNGVCFRDDAQIVGVTFDKYYGDEPSLLITLHALAGRAPAQTVSKLELLAWTQAA